MRARDPTLDASRWLSPCWFILIVVVLLEEKRDETNTDFCCFLFFFPKRERNGRKKISCWRRRRVIENESSWRKLTNKSTRSSQTASWDRNKATPFRLPVSLDSLEFISIPARSPWGTTRLEIVLAHSSCHFLSYQSSLSFFKTLLPFKTRVGILIHIRTKTAPPKN